MTMQKQNEKSEARNTKQINNQGSWVCQLFNVKCFMLKHDT